MIRKYAIIVIFLLVSVSVYSQTDKGKSLQTVKPKESGKETVLEKPKPAQAKPADGIPAVPAQTLYSDKLQILNVNFNKKIDPTGKGELLETQFVVKNNLDDPQDIYIFVIATFEKFEKTKSSFERPIPEKERIRSFVPYPFDISNFEYQDAENKDKVKLLKSPKNPKAGINPSTGKPYHLTDKLNMWTTHLSKYRNNYFFFNEVVILVYDKEGSTIFRKYYKISGKR